MNSTYFRKAVIISLLAVALSLVFVSFMAGYAHGTYVGLDLGKKAAINPRDPSEELEMACAGMWIGEQNRKYLAREKK